MLHSAPINPSQIQNILPTDLDEFNETILELLLTQSDEEGVTDFNFLESFEEKESSKNSNSSKMD